MSMAQLVLIRHGQSSWNLENRFTGWWDVNLTGKGVAEARAAGAALAAAGLDFDVAFTSLQAGIFRPLMALLNVGVSWISTTIDGYVEENPFGAQHQVNERNIDAVSAEAVLRVDPVGVDDLPLAIALQRNLAVAADCHDVIFAAFQPQFAHVHPRLEHLAGPVGRGEAQFLAGGVGTLQRR